MKKNKYLIRCKSCNTILMKVKDPMIQLLEVEMKCPGCAKIIEIGRDTTIRGTIDKHSKPKVY